MLFSGFSGLDSMGDYTYADIVNYNSIKSISAYGGKCSDGCTKITKYSVVHAVCFPWSYYLSTSVSISTSDVPVD